MSEERTPCYTITLRKRRKKVLKIEVFLKSQWTDKLPDDHYYRARINGTWYGGTHSSMLFLDEADLQALITFNIAEKAR